MPLNRVDTRRAGGWFVSLYAIVLILIGLALLVGGVMLARLGGSLYYVAAGALLVVSGVLIHRRRFAGIGLFALGFVGTVAWAYWEVGAQFWPLVPRLSPWIVLGFVVALIAPALRPRLRAAGWAMAIVLFAAGVVGFMRGALSRLRLRRRHAPAGRSRRRGQCVCRGEGTVAAREGRRQA